SRGAPRRARRARGPLPSSPTCARPAPPYVPNRVLNRLSIAAFNEFWYRKSPRARRGELQSIAKFFYPLDMGEGWGRIHGPGGFLQWQCLVPFGAEAVLREIVEALSGHRAPSFLAVLKYFGEADPGPLSFPGPGWTLALDVPTSDADLAPLRARLDERVLETGGRLYLAKDSRMRPEMLPAMYPRLDEWRGGRGRLEPDRRLSRTLRRPL